MGNILGICRYFLVFLVVDLYMIETEMCPTNKLTTTVIPGERTADNYEW